MNAGLLCGTFFNDLSRMTAAYGPRRNPERSISQADKDLAASVIQGGSESRNAEACTSDAEGRYSITLWLASNNADQPHTSLGGLSPEQWLIGFDKESSPFEVDLAEVGTASLPSLWA